MEIYRSSLPFTEILELESNPSLLFPCRFQAVFLNFGSNLNPNHLQLSILNQITKLNSNPSQCGFCTNNLSLSVSVDSNSHCVQTNVADNIYRCGTISVFDFDNNGKHKNDEDVDEFLNSVLKVKNVYSVVVVNGDRVRAVVGKYRHGWIVGRVDDEAEVVLRVAEIFVDGGREKGSIHEEFMPVGADGRIVLSFNLLNAEPNDWVNDSSLSAAYYSHIKKNKKYPKRIVTNDLKYTFQLDNSV